MKQKGILIGYFIALVGILCYFFHTEALYTLLRQEEVQLFLPTTSIMTDMLCRPGGLCEVLGKAGVQLYTQPTVMLVLLSTLLASIGILIYGILQKFASRWYHYVLALFPVWYLAKAHCSPYYILDGTVGIFFLLLFLYFYTLLSSPSNPCCHSEERSDEESVSHRLCIQILHFVLNDKIRLNLFYPLSTLLVYFFTGQLVAIYGLLMLAIALMLQPKKWKAPFATALGSILLTYLTFRLTPCVPLTDGIYSLAYQESQLQPDSYMYFIWLRTAVVLFVVFISASILKGINAGNRIHQGGLTVVSAVIFGGFMYLHLPNQEEVLNNRMEELSHMSHQEDWDGILQKYTTEQPHNYLQLNYLCFALAQKGELGNRLFEYNVKGPQSLLTSWDHSYYTSVLLSDIHYALGDISLSESYAMEGLTLAKRGGSPRMLQRLVKISLIRQEWEVAEKYLFLLRQMPAYRSWTETYQTYLHRPEKVKNDKELATRPLSTQTDNLFSMLSVDSLWTEHLHESHTGSLAKDYLGCSYLLAKELDKFEAFIVQTVSASTEPLPKHFQEALLISAIGNPTLLETIGVDASILNRFKQFQQDIRTVSKDELGLRKLHSKYGNTYWFYHYCKN